MNIIIVLILYFDESLRVDDGGLFEWILTPNDIGLGLHSFQMKLNDVELVLDENGKLPNLNGNKVEGFEGNEIVVSVPGLSYGFFVFMKTNITACG